MRRHGPFGPPDGCGPFSRRGYHHGRLREALLDAARRLMGERGGASFSLADAAKLAGVSPAAPYRHFRDRDALLAEVAGEGFALFGQRLSQAMQGAPDPKSGFMAMGRAYLAFAREQPGLYAAMFSWCSSTDSGDQAPARHAFDMLIDSIARVLGQFGRPATDTRRLAVQIWALSHGIATLAGSGQLGADVDADDLLADGTARILGLAAQA